MGRLFFILFLFLSYSGYSQGFLGQTKAQITEFAKSCDKEGNYDKMLAFKCDGRKLLFYFSGTDSTCDMCATDVESKIAAHMQTTLIDSGYKKTETRYLLPFLVSKKGNHQKFPAQIYSNGKVEYCFMPVSLNGKSAEENAVISRYIKKHE
ncbi:MAG: hypothetical protein JWO06_2197 [Bacteroidota bacterium]|nr:hypothetical protein [Bacteroidota bacterium]